MGETTPAASALARLESQKQYEQQQSPICSERTQPNKFQLLDKEYCQLSPTGEPTEHFKTPKQPHGESFSKSEGFHRRVDCVDLPCQASRSTTNASPSFLPNITAPNVQLYSPVDSVNQIPPNSELTSGMPTAHSFPVFNQKLQGLSHIVVVNGGGIKPQWFAEHPGIFSNENDQPHFRSLPHFHPSNRQPNDTCHHATFVPLVQHPHFHCNYWYPAFPLADSNMGTQLNNAASTSTEVIATPAWDGSSPINPISALNTGPGPSPRAPVPTSSRSDVLSALINSARGSDGSSLSNSSALRLSAVSAFDLVLQEPKESQLRTPGGRCNLVRQSTRLQPSFRKFVATDRQCGAPPTEDDQWGERTKHPGQFCLVEYDISALGQSKGFTTYTRTDQYTVSCLEKSRLNDEFISQHKVSAPGVAKCGGRIDGPHNCTSQRSVELPDFYLGSSPHLVNLNPPLNASASTPVLIGAPVNEEHNWNSLKAGQYSRETKTSGSPKVSNVVSPPPYGGQDSLARPENARTTVERHSGKGHWGTADDKLLIKLVNVYGTRRWSLIATFMTTIGCGWMANLYVEALALEDAGQTSIELARLPDYRKYRLGKQCRERWVNHLQPNIKKEDWTPEEEKLLVRAHATLGNRWSAIAKILPGRTDNAIKNHWHAALRKKGRHGRYRPSLLRDYIQRKMGAFCGPTPQIVIPAVDLHLSESDEPVLQHTVMIS